MTRISLRLYIAPGGAEVFINLKLRDDYYRRLVAMVDTGAAISLLPKTLMSIVKHRLTQSGEVTIEQAGIARQ